MGNEGNFGSLHTDGSEKPIVAALAAVKNLLSLNDDFTDVANTTDTSCAAPTYDGSTLSVSGIGASGLASRVADAVVCPKSDGTTLISVTNESLLTDGHGNDVTPPTVNALVHFGSSRAWRLFDPFAADPLAPVASGTSDTAPVALERYPMYILLAHDP